MKIGVLGTGVVGEAIGTKLLELGHEVKMGSRTANNEKALAWVNKNYAHAALASHGTFADAAAFGVIVFNCTSGKASLEVLRMAGADNLKGKVLIDIANPLDFSHGMPPSLLVCNTDSLGEQIQRAFPEAKVVKTLNTMNCNLMVNPGLLAEDHAVFVSGNDAEAKAAVIALLKDGFGWKSVIDLGDISTARGTEMVLPLWVSLMGKLQTPLFNFKLVK
jgi:8-hydroxy-5-deazaflavin:NADPH oxidoreductase